MIYMFSYCSEGHLLRDKLYCEILCLPRFLMSTFGRVYGRPGSQTEWVQIMTLPLKLCDLGQVA